MVSIIEIGEYLEREQRAILEEMIDLNCYDPFYPIKQANLEQKLEVLVSVEQKFRPTGNKGLKTSLEDLQSIAVRAGLISNDLLSPKN